MSTYTVSLRGSNFRPIGAQAIVMGLTEGDELILEPEPSNQYDPYAIRVIHPASSEHIGYVAKEFASEIAPMLEAGSTATCTVLVPGGKATVLEIIVSD